MFSHSNNYGYPKCDVIPIFSNSKGEPGVYRTLSVRKCRRRFVLKCSTHRCGSQIGTGVLPSANEQASPSRPTSAQSTNPNNQWATSYRDLSITKAKYTWFRVIFKVFILHFYSVFFVCVCVHVFLLLFDMVLDAWNKLFIHSFINTTTSSTKVLTTERLPQQKSFQLYGIDWWRWNDTVRQCIPDRVGGNPKPAKRGKARLPIVHSVKDGTQSSHSRFTRC